MTQTTYATVHKRTQTHTRPQTDAAVSPRCQARTDQAEKNGGRALQKRGIGGAGRQTATETAERPHAPAPRTRQVAAAALGETPDARPPSVHHSQGGGKRSHKRQGRAAVQHILLSNFIQRSSSL